MEYKHLAQCNNNQSEIEQDQARRSIQWHSRHAKIIKLNACNLFESIYIQSKRNHTHKKKKILCSAHFH